jgi:hypothetical protein
LNSAKNAFNPNKHTVYTPINEKKYVDKDLIICKSSWETSFCKWCDMNDNVIKWSSETLQIPYYDPVKKKMRRYFPDFSLLVKDINNKEHKYIVEVKPYKETIPPTRHGNKKEKTFLYEYFTYQTNIAKWNAAKMFCSKMGAEFKILTEKDIYKIQGKQ